MVLFLIWQSSRLLVNFSFLIVELKEQQHLVLQQVYNEKDVFVWLPITTRYGKIVVHLTTAISCLTTRLKM